MGPKGLFTNPSKMADFKFSFVILNFDFWILV